MGFFDAMWHLLGHLAPAFFVAATMPLVDAIVNRKKPIAAEYIKKFALFFIANITILGIGLVLTGQDGKVLTYACLVLTSALLQSLSSKIWK